tara:strand:- start:14749 stop:15057 length:309 start_codon:yes stop_codon:yes gene_type:complete
VKLPKKSKKYCNKCKKHSEHTVSIAKKRDRGTLKKGSIARRTKRGIESGYGNKGKTSKGAISSFKRTGAKTSKKQDLRYKCGACNKMSVQAKGLRAKKLELV